MESIGDIRENSTAVLMPHPGSDMWQRWWLLEAPSRRDLGGRGLCSDAALDVSGQRLLEDMAKVVRVPLFLRERGAVSLKHCGVSSTSSPIC